MVMPSAWLWIAASALASAYLVWRRLLAYLRYLQQEGYEHVRFLRWTHVRSLIDPAVWLAVAAAVLYATVPAAAVVSFSGGAVIFGLAQPDPRRSGKIPLKLTWRAKRILAVAAVLSAVLWALLVRAIPSSGPRLAIIAATILLTALPLVLIVANALLVPYERFV